MLVAGLVVAAFAMAVPRPAMSAMSAGRAVAFPAPPPDLMPAKAPGHAGAMVAAAEAAAPQGMTLGIAVLDLSTGELVQAGADEFYSASLSKLMLVVDMLDRDLDLSDNDMALIHRALSQSDDNAMNALWVRFGGPAAITRVADALSMAGTSTPDDPSQWGEAEVSPAGYARLYQHILTEMDPSDLAVIVNGLSAAQPRAADGFNQFFGLLGQPVPVYAKQGWMYYGSRLYLHSAGVVHTESRDYVVVLMSTQSAATRPAGITAVASALLATLGT